MRLISRASHPQSQKHVSQLLHSPCAVEKRDDAGNEWRLRTHSASNETTQLSTSSPDLGSSKVESLKKSEYFFGFCGGRTSKHRHLSKRPWGLAERPSLQLLRARISAEASSSASVCGKPRGIHSEPAATCPAWPTRPAGRTSCTPRRTCAAVPRSPCSMVAAAGSGAPACSWEDAAGCTIPGRGATPLPWNRCTGRCPGRPSRSASGGLEDSTRR